MVRIGCTQKLASEFKGRLLPEAGGAGGGLHAWHANLYRFCRCKSVLLVNDDTRFALFLPGLRKPDFQDFETVFRASLKRELLRFGISKGDVARVLLTLGPLALGPTHSRSVLATMNDMARNLEFQAQRVGRLPEDDQELDWVSRFINEAPYSTKERRSYFVPADEMRRLVVGAQ